MNKLYPGKTPSTDIYYPNHIDEMLYFMGYLDPEFIFADIGEPNNKSGYIVKKTGIDLHNLTAKDFNFFLYSKNNFDGIFCFEILEHLQNPLLFMMSLKQLLSPNGIIYLTMPAKPRVFWSPYHYNEIKPKHFEKWITTPLNLKIVKKKRIRQPMIMRFGIRPVIRWMFNYTWIYKIQVA